MSRSASNTAAAAGAGRTAGRRRQKLPLGLRIEYALQPLLRPGLYHVIVHVTDRCNLRCKTCFIEFGRKDLSVDEARILSEKLGYIPALDLGGGEPFLHRDLAEVCRQFRFGGVTIPTNGQFKDRVLASVHRLVANHPGRVTIALSLDGLQATNDAIRGAGTFEKAIETLGALREISGLCLKVNTVVNNRNLDELLEFVRYVRELGPDYHSLLLLRGDPLAPDEVELPSAARLRAMTPALFEALRHYDYGHPRNPVFRRLKMNYQRHMWETQLDVIEQGVAPFQCKAPAYNKVVYSDGRTSMCELKPVLANLLTESPGAVDQKLRDHLQDFEADHGRCFCTHNCNMSENIMTHPPSVAKVLLGLGK
ncbi:MAG: radical SAM protein [Candidatus Hydrogenedentes bacterium]|nr:radical SAM protein [Candidatus Hydrogenedentota bacterium]